MRRTSVRRRIVPDGVGPWLHFLWPHDVGAVIELLRGCSVSADCLRDGDVRPCSTLAPNLQGVARLAVGSWPAPCCSGRTHAMHRRLVLVGVSLVLLASATAAPSSAAATGTYTATFPQEQTVFRPCPPGTPPGAICFTGSDHSGMGTSDPPGGAATEDF